VPKEWSGPLVLRVYPDDTDPLMVRRERCAQEVVSVQGVPAPRVLACEDAPGPLDRAFMVMERLPGRPQMVADFPRVVLELPRFVTLSRRHAAAMHMVHALDAQPLLDAFAAAGIDRRAAGPEHWLVAAEATIEKWAFDGLRPGLEWLRAHRPDDPPRLSICHGDFFGANILEVRGRVTGILDWNLVTVADPAFDVGGQLAAAEMSPILAPPPIQLIATGIGQLLARRLRAAYAKFAMLEGENVRYYAIMRAFTELAFKLGLEAESRATGVERRMPTWRPTQCARYILKHTGARIDF